MNTTRGVLYLAILGVLISPIMASAHSFTDVSTELGSRLDLLIQKGIIQDRPDTGKYLLGQVVNRAEATKVIFADRDITQFDGNILPFKDVSDKEWYMPYMRAAYALGVMKGYPDNTLHPGDGVKKAEFFTMLYRMHSAYFSVSGDKKEISFSDVHKEDWFYDSVRWALSTFYPIKGDTFDPNQTLTREDMALIMYDYVEYFDHEMSRKDFGAITLAPFYPPQSDAETRNNTAMNDSQREMAGGGSEQLLPPIIYRSQVKYEYTGPALTDLPQEVRVRKVLGDAKGNSVSIDLLKQIIPGSLRGVVDSVSAKNALIQSFNFMLDPSNSYRYYLDLGYGTFSITQDWEQQDTYAGGDVNEEPNSLQLVAVVKKFLNYMGINLDGYGAGEVDLTWKQWQEQTPPEERTFPNYYSVTFPLLMDMMPVYSEWGYPEQAIVASIFAPQMKVTNVNGSVPRETVDAMYKSLTWDAVLEHALNGGLDSPYEPYYPEDLLSLKDLPMPTEEPMGNPIRIPTEDWNPKVVVQDVTVTLTKAEKVMLLLNTYDDNGSWSDQEYYVPGIMFQGVARVETPGEDPVTNQDVRITVPLLQEEDLVKPGSYIYAKG